ncbi:MAG: AsmA family protein [Caulobacteraceae bacterium]
MASATVSTAPDGVRAARPTPPRPGGPGLLRWIAGGIALLLVALAIFLALFNWDWFRPPLARMMSARLHRPVRIDGHLRVHLFSWTPSATLGGLKIGEPAWAPGQDLADIDNITVKAELTPLFVGRVVLPRVQIDRPTVSMFQDQNGRANWDFSNGKAPGKPLKLPPIRNFIINDGRVSVVSLQQRLRFTGTIYAHERAGAGAASGQEGFSLLGQGSLNGETFQMNATGGPLLNVRTETPYPFDAQVRAGDTRITAKGQVSHPFDLGHINALLSMSGHNLADLYYLTGLTLPNTPAYSISARIDRSDMIYQVTGIAGRVGRSDLEGRLKVDTSDHGRPNLSADLSSRLLDFRDAGALFGATGANAPQAPRLTATPQAATTARRLLPDAPLDVQRIRGMDADVNYRATAVRAAPNLPLRKVSLGVQLDHGLLTLDPIDLAFPQGRLSGTARIDARTAVQKETVDLRVSDVRLQDFLSKGAGPPPIEGVLDARARVNGFGDSVHKAAASSNGEVTLVIPSGVMRQTFAELMGIDATKGLFMLLSKDTHQTDLRCAIADFRVHDGVMQAQQIVLDTGVVLVNGSGAIDLNDETVKLAFHGQAKKFRLVKINAPILIGGHLSSPTFGVSPAGALAQGGVATALAAVVNPALLILPFVNLNLAHDANCSALVAAAQTQGAPITGSQAHAAAASSHGAH